MLLLQICGTERTSGWALPDPVLYWSSSAGANSELAETMLAVARNEVFETLRQSSDYASEVANFVVCPLRTQRGVARCTHIRMHAPQTSSHIREVQEECNWRPRTALSPRAALMLLCSSKHAQMLLSTVRCHPTPLPRHRQSIEHHLVVSVCNAHYGQLHCVFKTSPPVDTASFVGC